MLLNAFPIDVESGETRVSILTPPCHYMKLIQILPTDAAQVAIRFQAPPPAALPNQGWIVIRAGELVPMPYNLSVIGTPRQTPAAPQRVEVSVLYGPLDPLIGLGSQRLVFAYIERPDASDDPQGGDLGSQVFRTPPIAGASMALNIVADYSTKNLICAPARGATVGRLLLEDDGGVPTVNAGVYVAISEMHADPDGTLNRGASPVPIWMIVQQPGLRGIHFPLTGTQDYVRVRVWRTNDAVARGLSGGGYLVLSTPKSSHHFRMHGASSCIFTVPAATSAIHVLCAGNQGNKRSFSYYVRNHAAIAFDFYVFTLRNEGMDSDSDVCWAQNTAGPVAIGIGGVATNVGAYEGHAVVGTVTTAAGIDATGSMAIRFYE